VGHFLFCRINSFNWWDPHEFHPMMKGVLKKVLLMFLFIISDRVNNKTRKNYISGVKSVIYPINHTSFQTTKRTPFVYSFIVIHSSEFALSVHLPVSWTLLFWINALFLAGFVLDNEDRSVTRSDPYFRELFSRCGLHVYKAKVIYRLFIWMFKNAGEGSTNHIWTLGFFMMSLAF